MDQNLFTSLTLFTFRNHLLPPQAITLLLVSALVLVQRFDSKNASSERVIPIHPKLIELGFLNFVKEQKKNNSQRLFSHLTLGSDGYIKNVSTFFNVKWLHEIGV